MFHDISKKERDTLFGYRNLAVDVQRFSAHIHCNLTWAVKFDVCGSSLAANVERLEIQLNDVLNYCLSLMKFL